MMKRRAAVAGQFYHGTNSKLKEQVQEYTDTDLPREEAVGIVVPHAGLIYSGGVAGAVYSSIIPPRTFVMLGPNHTGLGARAALMDEGEWEIPTGTVGVDRRLASKIALDNPIVSRDAQAHFFEHSLEVQLPFVVRLSPEIRIVPVALLSLTVGECLELGRSIAAAVKAVDYPVVILASSDMSHYQPDKAARAKDRLAIERILDIDPEGLYETVQRERISMCGYLPVTVMLHAARLLGAGSARLVKYATSGEVSGDYDSVVGYAGIIIR
ncbi:MAG: AmmeMemoRadiSam system protein B [Candidatus Sulfobium sp.]|jgi:AmmeMemoRadiSam system protein B